MSLQVFSTLFVSTISVACFFALPALAAPPGAKSVSSIQKSLKSEWKLEQSHHTSGFHDIFFAPNAVRIFSKNFGYDLVSKGPDWDVYLFRKDDKVLCRLRRNVYYGEQNYQPSRPKINTGPFVGTEFVKSVSAKVFAGPHHRDWVAKFPGITAEIENLICAYYKSQPADGVVLRSVRRTREPSKEDNKLLRLYVDEHTRGIRLDTLTAKQLPYKESDFKIPANFRVVKDSKVVTTSAEGRREADSIIEQMGLGEELGTKKKRK